MSERAPALDLRDAALTPARVRTLDVESVSRSYGRFTALDGVCVQFRAGEIAAVVGPNGAGKTTLLTLLATLDQPSEGALRVDGRLDLTTHRDQVRPHIGWVAHDAMLYGDLSGPENLALFADLYGVPRERASEWLRRVGLEHAGARPVRGYSRGMKQRLSIARALLPEPSIVLFDEPLTGLDRSAREVLYGLLRWLRAQRRVVIVVTHHLAWPSDALDRVVMLERGRVRFDGALPAGVSLGAHYDALVAGVGAAGGAA